MDMTASPGSQSSGGKKEVCVCVCVCSVPPSGSSRLGPSSPAGSIATAFALPPPACLPAMQPSPMRPTSSGFQKGTGKSQPMLAPAQPPEEALWRAADRLVPTYHYLRTDLYFLGTFERYIPLLTHCDDLLRCLGSFLIPDGGSAPLSLDIRSRHDAYAPASTLSYLAVVSIPAPSTLHSVPVKAPPPLVQYRVFPSQRALRQRLSSGLVGRPRYRHKAPSEVPLRSTSSVDTPSECLVSPMLAIVRTRSPPHLESRLPVEPPP